MGIKVKSNSRGYLAFRLIWNGIRTWEGTREEDTPENRAKLERVAEIIAKQMKDGTFSYLAWFPQGNRAHLFREPDPSPTPPSKTVQDFYREWIENTHSRPQTVAGYRSQFKAHILDAIVQHSRLGDVPLSEITHVHLIELQKQVLAKGVKGRTVNAVVHSTLRAFLRDARAMGLLEADPFNRDFVKPYPETDMQSEIDPYTAEERDVILDWFRLNRSQFHAFVYFQFWTGARESETVALRWSRVDLRYNRARIDRSRVHGNEAGTKTRRSNREIVLHSNVVDVLRGHKPLHVEPEDYVFLTPGGSPIDQDNFYKREWLPALRRLNIRPRGFYNTRHTYASYLLSIGASTAFISSQTGDTVKTVESRYARYMPDVDSSAKIVEAEIAKVKTPEKFSLTGTGETKGASEKVKGYQGVGSGAGDRGRTGDLMLGKHTL